jgi:AcrR family transcriptional regulator
VSELPRAVAGERRRRRERGSIPVDEILNGAFEVAAQVSVDHLSMPLLAKHLDVGVTSIYWYFRKKDDLLDAMTDRALDQYDFSDPSIDAGNWRESLPNHARTMRRNSSPIRYCATSSSSVERTGGRRPTAPSRRWSNPSQRW